MIVHAITLAMHILYRSVQAYGPIARTFEYLVPGVQNYFAARVMSLKAKTLNSKHLASGDPLPPYTGTLRIYNMRYCPYAQRTVLVLNAKNIDYEVVNVNLAQKPEWLASKSPFTKVPAIEISEGVTVYESLVTAEYLDDVYPQRRLQSDDPLVRARDKLTIEHSSWMHGFLFKSVKFPESVDDEVLQRLYGSLDFIQAELNSRGSQFLGGSQPGYVDYMIWPWFERLPVVGKVVGKAWPFADKYARLTKWVADMRKDPAVSQYLIDDDIYAKFFEGYKNGTPRYDFLDEK